MSKRSFMTAGKKVLASAVSAAMVVAFTPVVAMGAESNVASAIDSESGTLQYYETLFDAVSHAKEGTTVTLLQDASGVGIGLFANPQSGQIKTKDLTIDFGGHTYTIGGSAVGSPGYESQAFHFEWKGSGNANANIVLQNGTVTSSDDSGVYMLLQNYSNLTLRDMTLDGTKVKTPGSWTYTYVMSNNCGNVSIEGSTNIKAKSGDVAFDVCRYSSYPEVDVTVNTTGVIDGKIEVSHSSSDKDANSSLTINSGSFTNFAIDNQGTSIPIAISGGDFPNLSGITYITDGATYGLNANASTDSNIVLDKSVTVDLNGHKLSSTTGGSVFQITNDKTLTIDGTDAGSEFYGRLNVGIATNNNGNIVLKGGSYSCADAQTVLHINGTCKDSDVTIKGATITSPTDNGIQLNGSGTFLIEDSTITGATAVYIKSGVTTIKNSVLTGNMTPANYTYNGNGANPTGDAIVIDACKYPGGDPTVNILSGTMSGTKAAIGYYQYPSTEPGVATINVSGGTFNTDPTAYKDSAAIVKINSTASTYTVVADSNIYEGTYTTEPKNLKSSAYCTVTKNANGTYTVTHSHSYSAGTTVQPTCTAAGYTTYTCSICGATTSTSIAALGHAYGDAVVTVAPTTTSTGTAVSTCSRCGATQTSVLAKLEAPGSDTTATNESGNKVDVTIVTNPSGTGSGATSGTVTFNGTSATEGSTGITTATVPSTVTIGGSTYTVTAIADDAFKGESSLASVTIPSTVTSIGEGAFEGCTALTSVTVPAGVTEIKDSTFAGCTSLTSVNVPDTVTSIGESAFAGCSSLTSTTIPAGVTSIEPSTFAGCTSLETVEVKGEITEIAADAFNGCTNLTSMTVAGAVKPMAIGTLATSGSLVIPETVVKVGDRAFKGTGITSVTVPAGVEMGIGVFRDCKSLTKAAIEQGVKTLSSYTFKGCTALKSVTVPSTVTKLERSVFSGCKNLTKVALPKSVTSIGKNALYGATKAKTLTINSKKLTKSGVKGSLAGSKVATVKVPKSMVSAYKKIFTKANCGKTVKVKAIA